MKGKGHQSFYLAEPITEIAVYHCFSGWAFVPSVRQVSNAGSGRGTVGFLEEPFP